MLADVGSSTRLAVIFGDFSRGYMIDRCWYRRVEIVHASIIGNVRFGARRRVGGQVIR